MNYIKLVFLSVLLVGCGDADRGKVFVTSQEGGITVIDLNSMEVTDQIDVGAGYPRGIGVTDDGKYLITFMHSYIQAKDFPGQKQGYKLNALL